ncbi:hypothetical protein B0I35DRAFT_196551 [Stachybotrys elegans]|uniref:Uncharacterized protein n=1 Tax=Stachybotrys elegans TaxID=80388 RepID=A0A8K0WK29_9HYPO|nr:hypothetical protein B0I35DRAFT_196551 [Stachybotrys elegans]
MVEGMERNRGLSHSTSSLSDRIEALKQSYDAEGASTGLLPFPQRDARQIILDAIRRLPANLTSTKINFQEVDENEFLPTMAGFFG